MNDPLEIVARVLEREGALVERAGEDRVEAVLPDGLGPTLGLPDAPVLTPDGRDGSVACGYGTEPFRAALARAMRGGRLAVARAEVPHPRRGAPEDVFAALNVALRPGEPTFGEACTLTAHLRVEAVADDRRVLHVATAVSLEDRVAIDVPDWGRAALAEADAPPPPELLAGAEEPLGRAASDAVLAAVAPFREAVARRWRRDVLQVERYFAEMAEDLERRIAKAGPASTGLLAKCDQLPAERERRLAGLRENALVRVRVEPIAALVVRAPVAVAPLEVLRRKRRRTLSVRFHPILKEWLPLACEACGAPTRAIGACDDAVHVLCARCLEGGGDRRCPRCAGPARAAIARLDERAEEESLAFEATSPAAPPPPASPRATRTRLSGVRGAGGEKLRPVAKRVAARADPDARSLQVQDALARWRFALTCEQLQVVTGLAADEVRAGLAPLVARGAVLRTGHARGTRYRAAPHGP